MFPRYNKTIIKMTAPLKTFQENCTSSQKQASIGEKGLILLNDNDEWQKLMEHLRSTGVSTNHAARLLIVDYLNRTSSVDEYFKPSCSCAHDQPKSRRNSSGDLVKKMRINCSKLRPPNSFLLEDDRF